MNNIQIARETMRITEKKAYSIGERNISLPELDFAEVIVYAPEAAGELPVPVRADASMCAFSVTTEDSFEAASHFTNPLVMNFANAHLPGGGFLLGARAQEEALCRCSTLYASLISENAKEMYRYNNTHLCATDSDYMLLSPHVSVFRNAACELLDAPFSAAVITLPAPNRYGTAALTSKQVLHETYRHRIRIMLSIAAKHGYRNLILGAWGCGAFGNDPKDVAEAFREILIGKQYGTAFDAVRFAVYGKPDGRNYQAFRQVFETTY